MYFWTRWKKPVVETGGGGTRRNAASTPRNAPARACASSRLPTLTSAPRFFQRSPLAGSRTSTRTFCFCSSSCWATTDPVCPETPATRVVGMAVLPWTSSGERPRGAVYRRGGLGRSVCSAAELASQPLSPRARGPAPPWRQPQRHPHRQGASGRHALPREGGGQRLGVLPLSG